MTFPKVQMVEIGKDGIPSCREGGWNSCLFESWYICLGRVSPYQISQKNAKMEVTISDFDETWYTKCPIWEYEMTQIWGRCDLQGPQ